MRGKNLLLPNINDWDKTTKGLYRFVISVGTCYEIYILHYDIHQPIETAMVS